MSRAQQLLTVMKTDEHLQARMQAAGSNEERKKVIEDAGFGDVSSADVQAANAAEQGELSDEQLGAASGAGGFAMQDPFYTNCWDTDW